MDFKIVLFAYGFPHRKTIDFINTIYQHNFEISLILAADYIKIKSPKSFFNISQKECNISAYELAEKYNIPIHRVSHNSLEAQSLLKEYGINFGIIGGSRILSPDIVALVEKGILNLHPGLLPDVRGLDSVLWSIEKDYPLGVTAHLINEEIDSGFILKTEKVNISIDDNLLSLYEKIYQLQLYLLPRILNLVFTNNYSVLEVKKNGEYNHKMSYDKQIEISSKIYDYVKKHSNQ